MLSGETRRVPIETVRLIAEIVGDPFDVALRAAAGSLVGNDDDDRLEGLDPEDPVVRHVMAKTDISESMRKAILNRLRHNIERDRERYIADVEWWANNAQAMLDESEEKADRISAALEQMTPEQLEEMIERAKRERD